MKQVGMMRGFCDFSSFLVLRFVRRWFGLLVFIREDFNFDADVLRWVEATKLVMIGPPKKTKVSFLPKKQWHRKTRAVNQENRPGGDRLTNVCLLFVFVVNMFVKQVRVPLLKIWSCFLLLSTMYSINSRIHTTVNVGTWDDAIFWSHFRKCHLR